MSRGSGMVALSGPRRTGALAGAAAAVLGAAGLAVAGFPQPWTSGFIVGALAVLVAAALLTLVRAGPFQAPAPQEAAHETSADGGEAISQRLAAARERAATRRAKGAPKTKVRRG